MVWPLGGALIIVPVCISEISPAEQRGRLVSIQQMNIVLGFLAAYFSNYIIVVYFDQLVSEVNIWRWMLAVELLPAAIYVILLPHIPESPVWLKSRLNLINRRQPTKGKAASLRVILLFYTFFLDWFMCQKKNLSKLWSATWRQVFWSPFFGYFTAA
ncbi:MAG: hypothetical protein CL672_07755 [Balneola sp.]|nr:hypothetical protein [Balneola sp.]